MTKNSFPFFISFNRGRASLLPVGSWRILILMLYLDGALISSCKRISPSIESQEDYCYAQQSHLQYFIFHYVRVFWTAQKTISIQ